MWFNDYDEYMFFTDLHRRAKLSGATCFGYDGHLYSMDSAKAIIDEVMV